MVKPTQKHIDNAKKILHYPSELELLHKAQELAENEVEQSEFITAEQARAFGAGNAVYRRTPKANLVKLDGELMSRAAAIAKYEVVKDKCDVWYNSDTFPDWSELRVTEGRLFINPFEDILHCEYQLRPKPVVKKQISWKDMPVGVMTNKGEFRGAYVGQQGNWMLDIERVAGSGEIGVAISAQLPSNITLAPASEQPWIAVQDDMPPAYEILQQLFAKGINAQASGERFKVTGIESGYVLGGN